MDIEKLTKSQIVLLTLLVSFVTSIATGIVTVSLMDQAPPAIAQTVNRIVEHTVEKVVTTPAPAPKGQSASAVVTTEKTVVVKESDLVAQAVERIRPSLVHLYTSASKNATLVGMGIVLDTQGSVLVDASSLGDTSQPFIGLADGTRIRALIVSRNKDAGTTLLRVSTTTVEGKTVTFMPAKVSLDQSTLGQSVVALSGKSVPRIADGLITAVIPLPPTTVTILDTNISADLVSPGSPLINTDGAIVGVSTQVSRTSSQGGFIASSSLLPGSQGSVAAE